MASSLVQAVSSLSRAFLTSHLRPRGLICRLIATSSKLPNEVPSRLLLSDACVRKLQAIGREDNCTTALRIVVEGGGCSGFQYKFELERDPKLTEEDLEFGRDGVKVIIDQTSLEFLKGSTVDYHQELIRSAFRITDNPLASDGCSCGASFNIKIE